MFFFLFFCLEKILRQEISSSFLLYTSLKCDRKCELFLFLEGNDIHSPLVLMAFFSSERVSCWTTV
jgi:hypothetical protein